MRDEKGAMSSGGVLAFDTSNYTTSAAIADLSGEILADCRSLLKVREGERGLRQSHALFQHVENLPGLVRRAVSESGIRRENICAVAVSERPRTVLPDGGRSSAAVRQRSSVRGNGYRRICRRSFRESISEKRVGRQTQKTGISGSLRRSGNEFRQCVRYREAGRRGISQNASERIG